MTTNQGRTADVSVIVPTLNESGSIDELLERLIAAIGTSTRYEILIVDDGSTDGTRQRVLGWESQAPVRLLARDGERGLNGAIMLGARQARGEVVVVMDADLSHPPECVLDLAAPVRAGTHDVVVGRRHVRDGRIEGWPLRRCLASRIAAGLAWSISDLHDPMSGNFATRRNLLQTIDPNPDGFKILLDLIASHDNALRTLELPITFRERKRGQSKLELRVVASYLRQLIFLAGGSKIHGNTLRSGAIALIGLGLDLYLFLWLIARGTSLGSAHVLSFIAATALNYVLNHLWSVPATAARRRLTAKRIFALLLVYASALILRGGVLGTAIALGCPLSISLMLAIGAAAAVIYVGKLFVVFGDRSRLSPQLRWRITAIGLTVYVFLLRLAYAGIIDLLPEETYYWLYAQHPSAGYLDHPPMVAWLIGASTSIFGNTELGVRLPSLLCWLVTAGFVFVLTRRLLGKTAALGSLLLVSLLPYFFLVGMTMTPDAPVLACWAAAIYFLHRALVDERQAAWLGVGVATGLGLLSKYTIALLGPPVFIFMLLDRRSRRLLWTPWPYLASVLALAIFSPVIRWNLQHNWESFAFQTIGRLSQPPTFSLHMLAISVLALLSPMAVIGCVQALKSGSVSANLQERSLRLLLLLTLAPLAIFTCFSLMHKIKLNWTGPLWLAFVPILGYWLWRGEMQVRPYRGTFHSVLWRASFVILLLLFGAALHALSLGLAGAPPSTRMALPVAWQELGAAVETIEKEVEQSVGYAPLVVGMDKSSIASELAFYRGQVAAAPGRVKEGPDHTASRSLFGLPALMWERWVTPREHLGRTMILISDKTKDLEYFRLAAWFDTLGFMHVLPVSKDGSLVAEFYYRIGYGYQHPLLALAENRRDPFADDEAQRRAPRAPQRHNS